MASYFGYWAIRGRGQPIRLLLAYTGEDVEEHRYSERQQWLDVKYNLGMDLPNLPYYFDDEVQLSQSMSIIRYLAGKYGLAGETQEDSARADMYAQDLADLGEGLARISYDPQFKALKEGHLKVLQAKLAQYEPILKDHDWFLGDKLSYVDFLAYELITVHKALDSSSFYDFPEVNDFLNRFEKIPQIKRYIKSNLYIQYPFFSPVAEWGGKLEQNPFLRIA